jgi:DnaJ-domain-containing protein 1
MDGKGITAEELKQAWREDFDRLAEEVAQAMNSAQPGRIIADSEEPVRDASAEFRQRVYERALGLLQEKQKAFSPSAQRAEEQG